MGKSTHSKVKKRLQTVKRGVIKRELATPGSKLNTREVSKAMRTKEALSGYVRPGKQRKNAFRSDDPDAEIPQHNFRQGPDFRSGTVAEYGPEAGYALVGANRPNTGMGTVRSNVPPTHMAESAPRDAGVQRLILSSEQIVPLWASKKTKQRLKNKSGVNDKATFRWC